MDAPDLQLRVKTLIKALDHVLTPRKRRRRAARTSPLRSIKKQTEKAAHYAKPEHLSRVRAALIEAAREARGSAPSDSGLEWEQLKEATKLSDTQLGLALSELIPKQVRSRHEGGGRIYFLPAGVRSALLREKGYERQVA